MNPSFETLFNMLLLGAVVWIVSLDVLIRRLKEDHAETYRALREQRHPLTPLVRFVLRREHQSLNDTYLSRLCDFMRSLFIANTVGLFGALFLALPLSR